MPDRTPGFAQASAPYSLIPPNGLRLVAQVRDRVLVCEAKDHVLLLDRERADALVRYEALRRQASSGALPRQNLLFPDRLELAEDASASLAKREAILRALGFDWSELGEGSYAVRSVPAMVANARASALLQTALDALDGGSDVSMDAALRAMASLSATPNGEPLDQVAAEAIVAKVQLNSESHRSCVVGQAPLETVAEENGFE